MIFRVFDIETIPDLKVWTPGEPTYRVVPGEARDVRVVEVEAFPPAQAHRVVSISYVDIECNNNVKPRYRFSEARTECRWSLNADYMDAEESMLLAMFSMAMDVNTSTTTLVSWNGRTFDLPVLAMRSFKHGVPFGWYYSNTNFRYRYSAEGHLDLMDFLSDFGAARQMKLHDASRLIGLPGKGDMTGASVEGVYKATVAGEKPVKESQDSVALYCLQDSIQTALVFLRSRYHIGKVTAAEYNACLDSFEASPAITKVIDLDWMRLRLPEGPVVSDINTDK